MNCTDEQFENPSDFTDEQLKYPLNPVEYEQSNKMKYKIQEE